jgi:RloB-like protein
LTQYRRGTDLRRTTARRRGNRVFYVVAEGEGTEYDYLRHLTAAYGADLGFIIHTPSQRRGLSASQVIDHAAPVAGDPDIDEVWGLFDHDGRKDIDQVCARARREGIQAALSHPAFELWLLLHFQDVAPAAQSGSNRVIIEKLRAADSAFAGYRDGSKRVDDRRFAALARGDGIRKAVERSRRLARTFSTDTPSKQDPSTGIHLLIESLGIVAGPSGPDRSGHGA